MVAPRDSSTRPTSDRVREALFSVLGSLDGAALDLYAGSGALGVEALSRGAERAVFVESRKPALEALRENLQSLRIEDRCSVISRPVERSAAQIAAAGPFALILADPPYALVEDASATRALTALLEAGALAAGGVLVLEHATRSTSPAFSGLVLRECRRYGDTSLSIYDAQAIP